MLAHASRQPMPWLIFDVSQESVMMKTKVSIVADGKERLMRSLPSTAKEREERFEELRRQLELKHRGEIESAGFFRRAVLRRKIRDEAGATMRREFGIPSDAALFFEVGQRANKSLEPTATAVTPRATE